MPQAHPGVVVQDGHTAATSMESTLDTGSALKHKEMPLVNLLLRET
jgi:hypothetical protein